MRVTIAKPRPLPARVFDLRQNKAKYMCACAYRHISELLIWINGAASGKADARGMRNPADELDPVFGAVASYFAMLADPTRLKIMHALCHGERTVGRIVADTGLSQTTVSRHLALMHRHGMATRRRDGNHVHYRIADETMPEVCRAVCRRIASAMDERRPLRRRLLALIPGPKQRAA